MLGDSGFTSSRLSHEDQTRAAREDAMALLAATPFAPDRFLIAGLCSGERRLLVKPLSPRPGRSKRMAVSPWAAAVRARSTLGRNCIN